MNVCTCSVPEIESVKYDEKKIDFPKNFGIIGDNNKSVEQHTTLVCDFLARGEIIEKEHLRQRKEKEKVELNVVEMHCFPFEEL